MKKIFLDTNILLDMLIREEYKPQIRELILRYSRKELYISFLSVANAAYIMRKYPKSEILKNIGIILSLFNVISNDRFQIEKAIRQESSDFEDMLQYQAALSADCEVILTRNRKDFSFSKIPVMSVDEYLAGYVNPV